MPLVCRCAATASIRYVNAFCPHCHEEHPTAAGRGAPARRLAGRARRPGLAGARLPASTAWCARCTTSRPRSSRYLEQWTAPTKAHTPDVAGNFEPVPLGLRGAGCGEMQTQHTCILLEDITDRCNLALPDLLRRVVAGLRGGRAARAGARERRHAALARERPHRRADAERRRADALPAARRAARRASLERPIVRVLVNTNGLAIAQDDDAARACSSGTASASRSTCSTTAVRPRRHRTTAAPTSGGSRSGRSSGCPRRASSRPSR